MSGSAWKVEDLVPHRDGMSLLDRVESVDIDARALTAVFRPEKAKAFASPVGVPNWVALEVMAQAAAALAGVADRIADPGAAPRPGVLMGTRRLKLAEKDFLPGAEYRVTAKEEVEAAAAAAFACAIEGPDGEEVASAILSAFRPPDFKAFIREISG